MALNSPGPFDSEPFLFDVTLGSRLALAGRQQLSVVATASGELALDPQPAAPALFELDVANDQWSVKRCDGTRLHLDRAEVAAQSALTHLSVIQTGDRVVLFLERDDPIVATQYSANMWLFQRLDELAAIGSSGDRQSAIDSVTATISLSQTMEISADQLVRDDQQSRLPGAIDLTDEQMLIGRNRRRVDICLPDVRVSGVHASIQQTGDVALLTDLGSTNGTYINGEAIRPKGSVAEGDRIQIGPYTLVYRDGSLYPLSHDNNVQLAARNLVRRVPDRQQRGETKVILDGISLVVRPREFVCILGPSGSGKSTLLSALSARVPANEGQVLLNGEDLYTHFDVLKQNLAVVPQKDVLHDVLPLNVALRYTARLRLPVDTTVADIDARVDATLDTVNLVQRQFTPIRKLSGGQIKRASWANEAICNPSLIFLDEVTSGLDEQTDSEMMQLFRRMADDGKTIVCVTHSLSYVEQNCNLLVILAPGGVLAFVGSPAEALEYFGVARLGDIYQRLNELPAAHWKTRFLNDELYQLHVERRMPQPDSAAVRRPRKNRWGIREAVAATRQFSLLLRRNATIKWADKRALAMMGGQSFFIALLLIWLFGDLSNLNAQAEANRLVTLTAPGLEWSDLFPETQQEYLAEAEAAKRMDRTSKLLFLLCISCIWFGCNNAAKEIIKERAIYNKERDAGLKVASYYGAKFGLLGLLSGVQASLLFWVVRYFTQVSGASTEQWLVLALSSMTGVAMGLAISALASSEDVAVTIVPMALIPQIILAGLIAPLLHYTREFSQLCVPAYWSYQGLLGTLEDGLQERLRDAEYLVAGSAWTTPTISGVLAAFIGLFAVVAVAGLYSRDEL